MSHTGWNVRVGAGRIRKRQVGLSDEAVTAVAPVVFAKRPSSAGVPGAAHWEALGSGRVLANKRTRGAWSR